MGKDRDFVSGPEQRVVLEHPCRKFLVVAGLDLDVDENELGFAVVRGELGHDVGPSRASLGEVGEDLLVKKLDVPEVESALDVREKELEEILQKRLQELLETLVVSHRSLVYRDEKLWPRPPSSTEILLR